jgi:hypothetical protein
MFHHTGLKECYGKTFLQACFLLDGSLSDVHALFGKLDLDNYHTFSVTKCLTNLQGFQYTDMNRSDQASHEKTVSKRLGLSFT